MARPKALAYVAALALWLCWVPAASAGSVEEYADYQVSMSGPSGPIVKGQTATYQVTVTNLGTATDPAGTLHLNSYRVGSDLPVDNPYLSVTSSVGTCERQQVPGGPSDYHSATCSVASLGPGDSAQISAVVEINESMEHYATARRRATPPG